MRIRAFVFAAAASLLVAAPSFAQGQGRGGGGARVGAIKSVDAAAKSVTITTRGRMNAEMDVTITTNDQTKFSKAGESGAFSDLKAGAFAVVLGGGRMNQPAPASEIIVFDKRPGTANGVVKSVDAGTKTVTVTARGQGGAERDVTIKLTDSTKYRAMGAAAKMSDVAAGKRIVALGEGNQMTGITGAWLVIVLPAAAQ